MKALIVLVMLVLLVGLVGISVSEKQNNHGQARGNHLAPEQTGNNPGHDTGPPGHDREDGNYGQSHTSGQPPGCTPCPSGSGCCIYN